MAAVLKKRALAEYSQTVQEQPPTKPIKKLRLVKKSVVDSSGGAYIGLLDKYKTSYDILQLLLRVSDSLPLPEDDIPLAVKRLCENVPKQKEAAVRVKILSLLGEIGTEAGSDVSSIVEDILGLLAKETSHKVIAEGLNSVFKLGKLIPDVSGSGLHLKLIQVSKEYLKDTNHMVKRKCLSIIGKFLPNNERDPNTLATMRFVNDYTHSEDPRVRADAFLTLIALHERGIKVDVSFYNETCQSLKDDYEVVRN
ncbi:hypothetical protein LSTR_LSTR013945 [Laodelphax striatellus]|uniref:Condensin complex subunit 1 C-terminal domain-containing protein n=1 Tax=Laodelphax striatellus TaxID=195883 RepID=A0A482XUU8_LAOST|nr:hypothetical protein LSTR_LSTR013945 [Laodelphax striatellus]